MSELNNVMTNTFSETPGRYISFGAIKRKYDVGCATLHRWHEAGTVRVVRMPGGKRWCAEHDVERVFGSGLVQAAGEPPKKRVCYARVSSEHQRGDLQRQIEFLQRHYPQHEVVSDVGSGLNWNRPRFKALLDSVFERRVEEIVVAYKDRLCRFGVEFVEWLCKKSDCRLVVHNEDSSDGESLTHELSDDLLSIVTVFVARSNGQRSALNRKRRRADHAVQGAQDTLASNARTA